MFCVAFALGCRWSNKIARLRLILAANVVLIWDDIEEKPNVATKPCFDRFDPEIFSVKTQRFNFQKQNRENQTTQKSSKFKVIMDPVTPLEVKCPNCKRYVQTKTKTVKNAKMSFCICCCCCLPCCIHDNIVTVLHLCPHCKALISFDSEIK